MAGRFAILGVALPPCDFRVVVKVTFADSVVSCPPEGQEVSKILGHILLSHDWSLSCLMPDQPE